MSWFLSLIPAPIKYGLIGALACLGAFYAGKWHGAAVETAAAEARAAQATIRQLKERGMINEQVHGLDDCALLRELDPNSVCDNGGQ